MISLQDLRFAFRSLAKVPGFSFAVIATLALGIGANTAIYSVVRGALLRPLPNRDGDRLVYLRQSAKNVGQDNVLFSVPEITDYRKGATTLRGFAEYSQLQVTILGQDEPVRADAGVISGNYFDVMGLAPVAGRVFDSRDDGQGAARAVVLTQAYWLRKYGGERSIVGKTINVNGAPSVVVGVVQDAPRYPSKTDIFVNMVTSPHHLSATMVTGRTHRMTEVFARLAPGADLEAARAELRTVHTAMVSAHPEVYKPGDHYRIEVTRMHDQINSR